MDPQLLRMLMHFAGFMMAVVVLEALPFGLAVKVGVALLVWLVDAGASELIYRRIVYARHTSPRDMGPPRR